MLQTSLDQPCLGYMFILCREQCLRQQGFTDVFKAIKAEENEKALALLPGILRQALPGCCATGFCLQSRCMLIDQLRQQQVL